MKKNRFIKIAALAATALLCCISTAISARAQCSPGYSGIYFINETVGQGCQMTIGYCINCNTNSIEIESIRENSPECDGTSFDILEQWAWQALIQDPYTYSNPNNSGLPCRGWEAPLPCGKGTPLTWSLIVNDCWQYGNNDPSASGWHYYLCWGENAYCQLAYTLCMDGKKLTYTSLGWNSFGDPACPPEPTPPSTWVPYQCYSINACDL